MIVSELIEELQKLPQDATVVLQRDPEGNGYEFPRGAVEIIYTKDGYAIEEVYEVDCPLEDTLYDTQEEWEEAKQNSLRGVVIYP